MNPFRIVEMFEEEVSKYAGSKYGVAVESCTSALFLCCKYLNVGRVRIPSKTYVGVAHSIVNAYGIVDFEDYEWSGTYFLEPYPIVDSARRFTKGMYIKGTYYCLSFHWTKHLSIGRGGMILTDDEEAVKWFKRARFDGRTEGVPPKEDKFHQLGYHFYMTPELAASGLVRLSYMPEKNDDLPNSDYPDLSKSFHPDLFENRYVSN